MPHDGDTLDRIPRQLQVEQKEIYPMQNFVNTDPLVPLTWSKNKKRLE